MEFKSTAYIETAFKLFVHDNQSQPEIAADRIYEAFESAIEFTFPCNGDGMLWRRKFLKRLNEKQEKT